MIEKRRPIELHHSMVDLLVVMSEANPGAMAVLSQLAKIEHGFMYILHFDDMNMRGSQIWAAYKDYCGQDINKLIECLKSRDQEMVNKVNEVCASYGHSAVQYGGSSR